MSVGRRMNAVWKYALLCKFFILPLNIISNITFLIICLHSSCSVFTIDSSSTILLCEYNCGRCRISTQGIKWERREGGGGWDLEFHWYYKGSGLLFHVNLLFVSPYLCHIVTNPSQFVTAIIAPPPCTRFAFESSTILLNLTNKRIFEQLKAK